ncbi:radical SAM protein [Isachenkonia alkalipeptolytica]|uniref:Radical SAM protein n=1 Tax=Isachenkonia alkalipeptolytica TaxID=2565777 RepID=A0AA43XJA5_9CLOT|nr:radical SAM protein [Isachenkonia alkalipeptolytica]NBG87843.1 radical SAM protein [Isachenkonia alkalipeptolytica]
MRDINYVYGPVPSRRLGISLGISLIPKKVCNYSCIYCQLGRTDRMTNTRKLFYPVEEILDELEQTIKNGVEFDVVTIVGEGEPTLYLGLGELILGIRQKTDKPVAVITNGALLYDEHLRKELFGADIVLPTMDAYDQESFKVINRPHGSITFKKIREGLRIFSNEYPGQLWIEIMLMDGINDDEDSLQHYLEELKNLNYDRLYINTPIRPPAEFHVKASDFEKLKHAAEVLRGISIDLLVSEGFQSDHIDDYEAILSIIKRHPMHQYEIAGFLKSRGNENTEAILQRLRRTGTVEVVHYRGFDTYRLK